MQQIEQGRLAPVEVKIARAIGGTAAAVEFRLHNIKKNIVLGLNVLNPLATSTFTISNEFRITPGIYKHLSQAVRNSNLPEGIYVAHPLEENPPKPFVTVTIRPTGDEAIDELFDKGASGYFVLASNADGTPVLERAK